MLNSNFTLPAVVSVSYDSKIFNLAVDYLLLFS